MWSVITTSSPGFRSIPRTIRLVPSLVLRVRAISSAETPSSAATLVADRFPERAVLVAILERRVGLEVAQQRGVPVEDGSRCRAHVGRVQVDEPLLERELPPDELPERLLGATASDARAVPAARSAAANAVQLAGRAPIAARIGVGSASWFSPSRRARVPCTVLTVDSGAR